jgi:hypothetical protein
LQKLTKGGGRCKMFHVEQHLLQWSGQVSKRMFHVEQQVAPTFVRH